MIKVNEAYSGFSVDDIPAAQKFYGETLGLHVREEFGMLRIRIDKGAEVLVYPKGEGHTPAGFTILNLPTDDIEAAVDELAAKGVEFEHYDEGELKTDERGIFRLGGPDIAWFKDPAGNILSVIAEG